MARLRMLGRVCIGEDGLDLREGCGDGESTSGGTAGAEGTSVLRLRASEEKTRRLRWRAWRLRAAAAKFRAKAATPLLGEPGSKQSLAVLLPRTESVTMALDASRCNRRSLIGAYVDVPSEVAAPSFNANSPECSTSFRLSRASVRFILIIC